MFISNCNKTIQNYLNGMKTKNNFVSSKEKSFYWKKISGIKRNYYFKKFQARRLKQLK